MKQIPLPISLRTVGVGVICLLLMPHSASSQMSTYLQVTSRQAILNEMGQIMPGQGLPAEEKPLVHFLQVLGGVGIQAPQEDGSPHPLNVVIEVSQIGSPGTSSGPDGAGRFNISRPRLSGDVFVRVYSHPTIAESPYYVDSELVTISSDTYELRFDIDPVNTLLKPHADSRGDGLTDAVREQLFGSASVDVFADLGDGTTVWDHFVAGTDWTQPDSFLAIASIRPVREFVEGRPTVVGEILEWASQTGRIYTIQYSTNLILGDYERLSNAIGIAATPPLNVFTNLDVPAAAPIYYRVEVDWPDMPEAAGDLIRP